jgi:hypothetical protein
MAGILTLGFFIHDIQYTSRYLGISLASVIFLVSLFCFQALIFLKEADLVEIRSIKAKNLVNIFRFVLSVFISAFCLFDYLTQLQIGADNWFSLKNIMIAAASIFIVAFPEIIFKIIFSFRPKRK